MEQDEEDQMLYVSFNQDNSCFSVGTERGYRIYDLLNPNMDFYERIMEGGIGLIEMLFKTNVLALVGGGKYPKYPQNKVVLWDDENSRIINELSFNGYVNNVKLKRDKIVIVCDKKIFVFNLLNLQNIDIIDVNNVENKRGLIALTYDSKVNLIAYPDKAIGYIRIKSYDINKKKILINGHDNALAYLCFDKQGNYLATASIEGINLRVFKADEGLFLYQFHIGSKKCDIHSIAFDSETNFLSTSTSNGNVLIFSLKNANEKNSKIKKALENANTNSTSNKNHEAKDNDDTPITVPQQSFWNKYFTRDETAWSTLNIPEKKSKATFGNGSYGKNKIIVIGSEGNLYMANFDDKTPGQATKEADKSLGINLYE